MTLKPEVDISKLHPKLLGALKTIDHLWLAFFPEDADGMTVTSGHEDIVTPRVHGAKSKHYLVNNASALGEAVDIRLNDVKQWKATIFAHIVWVTLTVAYDDKFYVFTEGMLTPNSHLHIQLV